MPSIADAVTDVVHTLVDITYEFKKQGIPEPVDIYSFRFRFNCEEKTQHSYTASPAKGR